MAACLIFWNRLRGHSVRVVTLSPLTSEIRIPILAQTLCGKVGSCFPMVGSLEYRTLTNGMYWFPLPIKLPIIIGPTQCAESDVKTQVNLGQILL